MMLTLNPIGIFENYLADRIITTSWRLRRLIHIEALMFEKSKVFSFDASYSEAFTNGSEANMAALSRYERSLENALYRAIKELKSLKQEDELLISEASICNE